MGEDETLNAIIHQQNPRIASRVRTWDISAKFLQQIGCVTSQHGQMEASNSLDIRIAEWNNLGRRRDFTSVPHPLPKRRELNFKLCKR